MYNSKSAMAKLLLLHLVCIAVSVYAYVYVRTYAHSLTFECLISDIRFFNGCLCWLICLLYLSTVCYNLLIVLQLLNPLNLLAF